MIHVIVADNGRGLPEGVKPSYGIAGMSERVWATGGEMRLTSRAGGGVTLDAWIPGRSRTRCALNAVRLSRAPRC